MPSLRLTLVLAFLAYGTLAIAIYTLWPGADARDGNGNLTLTSDKQ